LVKYGYFLNPFHIFAARYSIDK